MGLSGTYRGGHLAAGTEWSWWLQHAATMGFSTTLLLLGGAPELFRSKQTINKIKKTYSWNCTQSITKVLLAEFNIPVRPRCEGFLRQIINNHGNNHGNIHEIHSISIFISLQFPWTKIQTANHHFKLTLIPNAGTITFSTSSIQVHR